MGAYVRFRVAAETYALPAEHIAEAAHLGRVTPVPGSPSEVLGVLNLRGQILPVIDLAALLGVTRPEQPRHLLVAEASGRRAGFAVEELSGIGELSAPAAEGHSELLAGSLVDDGRLVGVLDADRVFAALERVQP
jgi:chemotaxis signal transduction protein